MRILRKIAIVVTKKTIVGLRDGAIYLSGDGQDVIFPDEISPEFLMVLFSLSPNDRAYLGRIAHRLPAYEAKRFHQTCRALGGELLYEWQCHARRWPKLLHPDNCWDLRTVGSIVLSEHIDTGVLTAVYITDIDLRLCQLYDGSLVSTAQFYLMFGESVHAHLGSFVDKMSKQCTVLMNALSQPLRKVEVVVADSNGDIASINVTGPAGLDVSEWKLPGGAKYIAEKDTND